MAKLHEIAFIQANDGYPTCSRSVDDRRGARAQVMSFDNLAELRDNLCKVEFTAVRSREEQHPCRTDCLATDHFIAGAKGNFVHARHAGFAGFSETGLKSREVL